MNQQRPAKKTAAKTAVKKAAAKKTAASKQRTLAAAPDPVEAPEAPGQEQAQPGIAIANQAAFAQAVGLDPNLLVPGSLHIKFDQNGVALVVYQAVHPVTPQQLSFAFAASAGMLGDGATGQARRVPDEEATAE